MVCPSVVPRLESEGKLPSEGFDHQFVARRGREDVQGSVSQPDDDDDDNDLSLVPNQFDRLLLLRWFDRLAVSD